MYGVDGEHRDKYMFDNGVYCAGFMTHPYLTATRAGDSQATFVYPSAYY